MANKRQLKKAIRHSCGKIAGECLIAQATLTETNPDDWDSIVIDAAMLQVNALKKVNPTFQEKPKSFANGKEYKAARRAFYRDNEKQLTAYIKEEVGKIAEKMNSLIPKK